MSYASKGSPYGLFEKQSFTPNGVIDTFTLNYRPGKAEALLVVYNGNLQEPGNAYALIDSGKKLKFNFVPQLNKSLYVVYLGRELLVSSGPNNALPINVSRCNETPTGNIDGINTVFSTAAPFVPGTTRVYLNGLRLTLGVSKSYRETGPDQITLNVAPQTGDEIIIDYDSA